MADPQPDRRPDGGVAVNDGSPSTGGPVDPASLYVLGVGGPLDADGIGRVERFAWRFLVRRAEGEHDAVLGFTSMPRLMAFTRAVNAARPFTVSTEVYKVPSARFALDAAPRATVDLAPEGFSAWLGRGELVERIVPELEG